MSVPAPKVREQGFTYGDYRTWSDDERWELIDGEAFRMPAPTRLHQDCLLDIAAQVHAFLRGHQCRVYIAPFDVRLPATDEPDEAVRTVVQPDLAVICDPAKLDTAGCRGAPDWVIEILSRGTAARDQIDKLATYERAGVAEYWLVHPLDRVLTIYRLQDGAYGKPAILPLAGETPVGVLAGLVIDWSAVTLDADPGAA